LEFAWLEILSPPRRINCAAIYTGRGSNVTLAMKCCKHLPLIRPRQSFSFA
jgi:hypothetical protein